MSEAPAGAADPPHRRSLHPVAIMLWVIIAAALLTHLIPAGRFARHGALVEPGTYRVVPKVNGLPALLARTPAASSDRPLRAAGVVSILTAVPDGMVRAASLMFMVTYVGGVFGIMRRTGAIDAGVDRLLHLTRGNVYVLVISLMALLACGATFLGFISEYLVIIPIVGLIGDRMGLPRLFAVAVVGVAAKVGYAASVTNPIALAVAQPLAGVPLFSGFGGRFAIFAALLAIGAAYVLFFVWRAPKQGHTPPASRLTWRQGAVLLVLAAGGAGLLVGSRLWGWSTRELSAVYLAVASAVALAGGLGVADACDAFVDGMRSMWLAAVLVGLAAAVEVILRGSGVLDTVIQAFANLIAGQPPPLVAIGLMLSEMALDVLIPSVSGKAALSMPVLAPLAHLAGLSPQTAVTAFLLGGGLTNMVTPTSGMLLAYLSAGRTTFAEWVRFVFPLFAMLWVASAVALLLLAL